jgi:hypothetical protein
MSDNEAESPGDERAGAPGEDFTPRDGAFHVAFIVLELELVVMTASTVDCGSMKGVAYLLWLLLIVPQIGVPSQALIVGIPSLIAFFMLRRTRRRGASPIWWRVQVSLLTILAVLMLAGKIIVLSGNGSERCDYG